MTQAVLNNKDILQAVGMVKDRQSGRNSAAEKLNCAQDTALAGFDNVLGKTLYTVGDIKNMNHNGDMSEELINFREILAGAAREVNMEKALELTLAHDVSEIADWLKGAIGIGSTDADMAIAEDVSCEDSDEEAVEIIPVFEQVLNVLNTEQTPAEAEDVSVENDMEGTEQQAPLIKPKEVAEDSDKEVRTGKDALKLDDDLLNELNIESLSSEADASENFFTDNKQSAEELGMKIMLNNNEKLDLSFQKTLNASASKSVEVTSDKIIEQITKQIDAMKSNSKINIVLNPESLGKVNLQIMNTKDGLTAQFTVMTNNARELLMKGLDGLKESLLAQGVSVDNISVKISEPEEAYNPDWTEQQGSDNKHHESGKQNREEKEKGLFEKTIAERLDDTGVSI